MKPVAMAALAAVLLAGAPSVAEEVLVTSAEDLQRAMRNATAGDVITLAPGTYRVPRIRTRGAGTAERPITVRAERLGEVLIEVAVTESFVIGDPHWTFENLDIRGVCSQDRYCEHAFHIVGKGSNTIIRNNRMRDFNAMIKGNGQGPDDDRHFPDDVLIEDNAMYNLAPRMTRGPVTPIDVMGGQRWIVRHNFIADFAKAIGNMTSYGAFLKGNSSHGIFEGNLIACEWRHRGGIRVGLSFGGGGTSTFETCEDFDCTYFHRHGTVRNNLIMDCPEDVGIYLNKSYDTKVYNNTLYNTHGIDVRFVESTADIRNNIITGSIRSRDGGSYVESDNIVTGTWISPWLPGAARYIKKRLTGQDAKYPNWVAPEDVEWAKGLVDRGFDMVADTWMATGTNAMRSWYADPDSADFTLVQNRGIVRQGQALADVTEDFCGNPRPGPVVDLGAIEHSAGGCNLRARIDRLTLGNAD